MGLVVVLGLKCFSQRDPENEEIYKSDHCRDKLSDRKRGLEDGHLFS